MDERFSRQLALPQMGPEGQRKLRLAHVLVIGCGALGSHTSESLLRAGVGKLTLVDRDVVEEHNLHRVSLMSPQDVGRPKAEACADALLRLDPNAGIRVEVAHMGPAKAEDWIPGVDVVVDGLDNLESRYLVNDVCVKHRVPWIYTAVIGTHGMNMPIRPGEGPCLRCLFPEPPPAGTLPTCATAGILGPVPMALAALQAAAAIKLLLQPSEDCVEDLVHLDLWSRHADHVSVPRSEDCPTCGRGEYEFVGRSSRTSVLCGDAVQVIPEKSVTLELDRIASRLDPLGSVRRAGSALWVELPDASFVVFPDGRALIKGTQDPRRAQALYDQYVAR